MTDVPRGVEVEAGLCGSCRNALVRPTRRGTVYLRCGLASDHDAQANKPNHAHYPKYPRLPVLSCDGYRPVPG